MRVLFCGGGTAGHVNPAIAIAQTIMRNSSDSKVAYVATMNGIENSLVDFKKYHIDIRGMKRRISIENVKTLFLLMDAIKKSKQIIKEFHPDIIVGTGGYATYPVIYAGHKLGVKTVIHESNALPGKATKMLQKKVDKIFTNFKQSERFFKDKNKIINRLQEVREPIKQGYFDYKYDGKTITNYTFIESKSKNYIKIYEDVKDGYPYVLGGDTAGIGKDSFAGDIINNNSGNQCATLELELDETEYTMQMYCLGMYYNEALMCIETNYSTYPVKKLWEILKKGMVRNENKKR